MSHPNKKRLRRSMMFLNAQKPSLIKDPYLYGADSLMLDLEDAVAVEVAEQEHHAVAGEHADHAHHHHDVFIAVAEAGNHAAGNQGDVFWNGNAETAGNQHHEYGGIAVLGEQGF